MIDYNALIEIKEKTLSPRQIERLQLNTEIGAFIAANWAGAYDVFNEFWKCALEALEEGSMTKPTHQNDNCEHSLEGVNEVNEKDYEKIGRSVKCYSQRVALSPALKSHGDLFSYVQIIAQEIDQTLLSELKNTCINETITKDESGFPIELTRSLMCVAYPDVDILDKIERQRVDTYSAYEREKQYRLAINRAAHVIGSLSKMAIIARPEVIEEAKKFVLELEELTK